MARILTITLNPALDLNLETGAVSLGTVNRSRTTRLDAAGKGINLGCVLSRLGHRVCVSGLLGGLNAAPFERLFETELLEDRFIRVPGQNRINVKIAEDDGRVTDLNGPGFTAPPDSLQQLEASLDNLLSECDALAIAGSLPADVSPEALSRLIARARKAEVPVWLDTSGPALAAGIAALPDGIKPNLGELSQWAGRPMNSPEAIHRAARKLQDGGIDNVVISMGAKGVLWLSPRGNWQSCPPPVRAVSTVCAGDTLLAGLLHGLLEDHHPEQVLSTATALSAECVRHTGVGDPMAEDFTRLIQQTRVTPWPGQNNNGEMPL
ncbi:1-phosphofructokinase [Marinobacter halotolerans]|uniref:1-phosphofructokinase n=1 Tax=Marinobacter halotolerans TaxID=1569211 RepID=UPI001248260D|nr:1-phosphofructokinase [Marinobacter halotolerans]